MSANTRQEDFLFAEHVLRRGFSTEEQVQECLRLLERLRGEMELDETLENILLKKGYLAQAQAQVIHQDIDPEQAGRAKNQIEGYQLLVRLGSGAMGSVYKAHHQKLNIPVALKVLRVDLAKSKTQIERLKREAQLAARLNHPNIVRSLDVGESNGFHYFAMEFVDGRTVRQLLHRGRVREREALRIIREVARALEHAHAHGVIHRDVKPANIILTRQGRVKLADFGLARGKGPSDLTLDQASIGTPQYLAPEQARRGADATPRSDLFSLGASLYHVVTGRPPFSGENLGEIFQKVLSCEFDPPESAVPDLSLDTVYLIHRLMRAHPRERYASATELLADLERIERGERVAPAGFKGDYRRYLHRRRTRRALIGAASVLVVAVASLFTASTISAHRKEQHRSALCQEANGVGRTEVQGKLNSIEELRTLLARITKARPAGCEDREVAALIKRQSAVRADLESLREAEACATAAQNRRGDFRTLLKKTEALHAKMHLSGPRLLVEEIQRRIRKSSDYFLGLRGLEVDNPGRYKTAAEALEALEAFEADLGARYIEGDNERQRVAIQAHALRVLIRDWERAEEDYAPLYRRSLEDHDFKTARANLDRLMAEHEKARGNARRARIDENNFLDFFPEYDARDRALRQRESEYFETVIRKRAQGYLENNDPDEAERVVRRFRPRAVVTSALVESLKVEIDDKRKRLASEQDERIRTLKEVVRRALQDRQYGQAWNEVNGAAKARDWIPSKRAELNPLLAQARMYKALLARFKQRATQLRPAGGDNPDLFLDGKGRPVTLRDWETDALAKVMAFEEPRDNRLEGYFWLVESYHEFDPRKEEKQIGAAIFYLKNDPIVVALARREIQVKLDNRRREQRAREQHEAARAAAERKDQVKVVQLTEALLARKRRGSLWFTDYREANHEDITHLWEGGRRRGSVAYLRLRAGLPPENLDFDQESEKARFTFTFKEWWPDEGQVPRRQLPKLARIFWRDFFNDANVPKAAWPRLTKRAMHQLLWFNEFLVADKHQGGARFDAGRTPEGARRPSNYQLWRRRRESEMRAIRLRNPFRTDQDWSIEVAVTWDVTDDGQPKSWDKETSVKAAEDYAVPGYFALTAGELQAGIVASPNKHGGGHGLQLFVDESLTQRIERLMYDFRERLKYDSHGRLKPKRKLSRGADRSYTRLDEGVPYRMRLERKGSKLLFSLTTQELWLKHRKRFLGEKDLAFLQRKLSPKEFERAFGKDAVFRIFSFLPPRLLEVVLSGTVPLDE